MLYPLSYEGGGWRILGRKPATRADRRESSPVHGRRRAARSALGDGLGADSGAPKSVPATSVVCARAGLRGELGAASLVAVECEAVDHECVAEEVEVLAGVADAVGASEPEGVFEVAVDRLGVVAAWVQPGEVRVGRGDGADVLGAVELPGRVLGVGVEPDGDALGLVTVGEDGSRCTSGTCRSCRDCDGCGRGGVR